MLVLLAGMLRVVRGVGDPETRSEALIVDVVIRVMVGIAAIYVGFPVLAWLLPAISSVGAGIFGALLGIMGAPVVRDPLGVLLYTSADPLLRLGLIGLLILPFAIWFMARVIGLLIMRFLIVVFGVMFLPLLIAVAVYDPKHKAVRWWAEALGSAAIIPIVTACLFGGTLGLAMRFGMGDPSDGLFSFGAVAEVVVAIGGLWLSGKVLRRSFSTRSQTRRTRCATSWSGPWGWRCSCRPLRRGCSPAPPVRPSRTPQAVWAAWQ